MILNINELPKHTCGIYKINYFNKMIYIGQAINIRDRALEHNLKNKQKCDKELKKNNAIIEILEVVENLSLLDERETFYIKKYNATNPQIGYNIFEYGDVAGKRGYDNPNAAFTKETLAEVIELLIYHKNFSLKDIANKYNVHPSTIFNISKGHTYYDANLCYPLRENDHSAVSKNNVLDYFSSIEELLALKEDLLYNWDLAIETNLVKKYNIPLKIIHEINTGKKFQDIGKYQYPIRFKNIRNNLNFTKDEILEILNDLSNSSKSMTDIGLEHKGIHRNTVSKINQGLAYPIKEYNYPARKK